MTRTRTFHFDDWEEFERQQDWHSQHHRRLDTIEMEPVEWLWPGFIPRGMITILTGEEGLGKSQLAYKIAAYFSTHGPINPGTGRPGGMVKLYSAEDPEKQVLVPRVKANGADMGHIYTEGIPDSTFVTREGIAKMAREIEEFGFELIVIDPIIAYFSSRQDTNAAQDVRAVMRMMSALAEQSGAVFLCVTHPKKGEETQALHKMIGGSSAFGQAARSVLAVARYPGDDNLRVVGRLKGNLERPPRPYIFEIVPVTLRNSAGQEIKTSKVKMIGEVEEGFDFEAAVLRRPQPTTQDDDEGALTLTERCKAEIREQLRAANTLRRPELKKRVVLNGFKEAMFERAMRQMQDEITVARDDAGVFVFSLKSNAEGSE